jgi:hypothetical protein
MRTLIAFTVSAFAGAVLIAAPSAAAPLAQARPEAAPLATQVQYGYGERREEYRERRDYDGDRYRRREEWRGDGDDWRRREYRRRMFCRMHPDACDR